jgi:hypothetical protein
LLIKGLLCINNSNKYSGNTPHQLKQWWRIVWGGRNSWHKRITLFIDNTT